MISPSCQPLDLPGQPNRMEDEEAESGCDEDELQEAADSKDDLTVATGSEGGRDHTGEPKGSPEASARGPHQVWIV